MDAQILDYDGRGPERKDINLKRRPHRNGNFTLRLSLGVPASLTISQSYRMAAYQWPFQAAVHAQTRT